MGLIAKVSKGSRMDQIYLPKSRIGLSVGQYVAITPLEGQLRAKKSPFKPFFYNVKDLEPLKLDIIEKIFKMSEEIKPQNIIITGSFLEKGFKFNDIDIVIITENKEESRKLQDNLEKSIQIKIHALFLTHQELMYGLSTDPLYSSMVSKCISKKRLIFKATRVFKYKHLDIQLLKSKDLIDNFDIFTGEEKYYLTMNLVSLVLFVQNEKVTKEKITKEIERIFDIKIKDLKGNVLEKNTFLKKYKETYNQAFKLIMENIHE